MKVKTHNKAKHRDVFFVAPAAPQKIRACWRRYVSGGAMRLWVLVFCLIPLAATGSECGEQGGIDEPGILNYKKKCEIEYCYYRVNAPKEFEGKEFWNFILAQELSGSQLSFSATLEKREAEDSVYTDVLVGTSELRNLSVKGFYHKSGDGCAISSKVYLE